MKIGVFGGSFDPVHAGHTAICRWMVKHLSLERVTFIPSAYPPHKNPEQLTSIHHRKAMVELAIRNEPVFSLSDIESTAAEPHYTVNTLKHLREKYPEPDHELYLILGADSLLDLPTWRQPEDISRLAQIVIARRPETPTEDLPADLLKHVTICDSPLFEISATVIRQKIKDGNSVGDLIDPSVERYIIEHRLYR